MNTDVGITHYSTTTKGIGGSIKKKISDFIVKEITFDGKKLETKAFGSWEEKRGEKLIIPKEEEGKEYLHVSMEKFNLDTNKAVMILSRQLRSSQKRIGYGGMKDKRAITVQRISIWNPDKELLEGFYSRYIDLREPEWSTEKLEIGKLIGNEFEITIRNIQMKKKELKKNLEECISQMQNGVANYFGEQRFGGNREVTHLVGRAMIENDFEKAAMIYLTKPAVEEEEIATARKNLLETRDFAKAVREYPPKFRFERSMIHHLCKFPKDYVGAFQNLPRNIVFMFTHAYQSYLFNQVINRRIETGIGLQETEGDVLEDSVVTAPLFGFESEPAKGKAGEIEKMVLEEEKVKLADFKVKGFPEVSCSGTRKKIAVIPENVKVIEISEDELNEGALKARISFGLSKGNYATTILREIMKNDCL